MLVDFGHAATGMASAAWMQPQPVLAQVVFGGNPAAFLGIALAVGGAGLYFLRNFRPQVARDQDIALSAVSLLCGTILMFQGWRLDPILTFGFYLMAGAATAFALETLRLRGATTEQAKRFGGGGQIVDDERPVSRVYRAELDELGAVDERPASRRIRASRDYRTEPTEDYGSSSRRPAIRGSPGETRPPVRPERDAWDDDYSASSYGRDRSWEEPSTDYSGDYSGNYSSDYASGYSASDYGSDYASSRSSSRSSSRDSGSRPRRPRSVEDVNARWDADEPARPSADYVDYQPVDYSDDEADNSSNFD
ncbi:Ycf66 family protein [Thermoleptolyngbya sp. M55_K2018_002]|uniref:Ycf66 family protein n=1 Tax=Thermoleptolyngbya sp. M55_K2018_002 TaxID=2747808 RepID=UPI0025EEBA07|nr:Ycf66 family protein [Thermoleptolyngbya sp. M55_K2018_002]